jgi:hypothetical protein
MAVKSSAEVMEEIRRLYNKNPRKWHVLMGRDSRGYTSTIVLHVDKMWIIKDEPINPYESIGCGLKVGEIDESLKPFLKNPHTFGFRPVPKKYLEDILEAGVIGKILNKPPVSAEKIASPAVVGPITLPTKPIDFVSEKQRRLDRELSRELDRLIYKKRPDILRPYV